MLKVSNLSIDYGDTRIVDHLSLSLSNDEILMLVGPTGCGKTTILNAIAGLVPISNGSIQLGDWQSDVNQNVPPEHRNVGMVFQDFALFPHLTVEENVCFRLREKAPADRWLSMLGLSELKSAKPARLSGGQKQRVALARALAHEPSLLLLDEPLSNLDAALKETLRWEIRDALKQSGIPALWVTHDQSEALSVGDRLGVLEKGQLVQLDEPQECYLHPANRFTASFLGIASFVGGTLKEGVAHTPLGSVIVKDSPEQTDQGDIDVLIRPEDCEVAPETEASNGEIISGHFEGGHWLYSIRTDSNTDIQVRTHHRIRLKRGQRVNVRVDANHPLTAFPAKST